MKIFRRSWHEEEKCCKLSGWANIIFVKEVSRLDFCYSMRSNNSLALRVTTHRYRFDQEIFKNSPLIAQFKIFWGVLLSIWGIFTIEKWKEFLLSNNLYINVSLLDDFIQIKKSKMITLMFNSKFKFLWI